MDAHQSVAGMTPAELAARLEGGEALQVLDVRAPQRLASGTVDLGSPDLFFNIPNSQLFSMADPAAGGLSRALPVVAVCGHGHSSQQTVAHLIRHGYHIQSLAGGMAAWMNLLIPRELPPPPACDRLVQFDRIGKGALSYLLISGGAGFVIDPPRDCSAIEQALRAAGATLVAVADTHAHADYLSGGAHLAWQHGVPYYLHPADAVSPFDGTPGTLAFRSLHDGMQLALGAAHVAVEHTPGHTAGSVCFLVGDAAFTGDFIFIDSVGRPDLGGQAEAWTAQLCASLARVKAEWPAGLRILPAHYATAGERNPDRSVGRVFGEVRQGNHALGIAAAEEFATWVAAHTTTPPLAYRQIKLINLGLATVSAEEADVLELGRNECAAG